tara:strand:+ start:1377 stop:1556 length:180 start_codon:yes stop_codon:yes gene_type:complete
MLEDFIGEEEEEEDSCWKAAEVGKRTNDLKWLQPPKFTAKLTLLSAICSRKSRPHEGEL